ncbi:hypothetical protein DYB32_007286 [Aphanomyces invadans]|uniref:FYVE-type domain-containing protein n=1 Tax=Aphanomyces invadans TaxID=157072 RepID=A0A418AP86_9STRA|nr:hypothetical protein DYB32_007286 [Aphanomyces invadans]
MKKIAIPQFTMYALFVAARSVISDSNRECQMNKKHCRLCRKRFNPFRRRNSCAVCHECFCSNCIEDDNVVGEPPMCLYCADSSQQRLRMASPSQEKGTFFITFEDPRQSCSSSVERYSLDIMKGSHLSRRTSSMATATSDFTDVDELYRFSDDLWPSDCIVLEDIVPRHFAKPSRATSGHRRSGQWHF